MIIWALAKKEMRLLLRDRMAVLVLLGMPLVFILLWGLLLGENFGQKTADEKLRVFLVDQDRGEGLSPGVPWSKEVFKDLNETAGVRVEPVAGIAAAQQLLRKHKVAAVLVLKPGFSEHVNRCSFLADRDAINPFHRDGVYLDRIDAELLRDPKQPGAASIIDQVAQVSMLRVLLPWMISRAFDRLSEPQFIEMLGKSMVLPGPLGDVTLGDLLKTYSLGDSKRAESLRGKVGKGVQDALDELFRKYDLKGKTWAALTKSLDEKPGEAQPAPASPGWADIGGQRFQQLVPSFAVMFPFFLAMVVGWVFVTERRQGTLKRLRFAPVSRAQVLAGKLLPVFVLSMGLAAFLLVAGRLIFGMSWGPETWPVWLQAAYLVPVVVATSFASMGLALLVAAVSRSEIQVALFGALPVLVMALVSGCILPREMMTESAQYLSWFTPHGWALAAYRELLGDDPKYVPDLALVWQSCGVLTAFGAGFLGLAWALLRLD
jgi:linearmycin/streptolysin S transport system permease protein